MRLLLLLSLACCLAASRAASSPQQVVMLVTLEEVSLDHLAGLHLPELPPLLAHGAIGIMNNKTAGTQTVADVAVTISAGRRARSDGHTAHTAGQASPTPGLLASSLREAGITLSFYGNSDQGHQRSRLAAAIVRDQNGVEPDSERMRDMLATDNARPFGVRMDYAALLEQLRQLPNGRHFVVVEAGDLRRLLATQTPRPAAETARLRETTLRECLRFVQQAAAYWEHQGIPYTVCLVVVQQDATALAHGDPLPPVLITGSGWQPGLLISGTTRRPGVITNIDLTATVLHAFGLPRDARVSGLPASSHPDTRALPRLLHLHRQAITTYTTRTRLLVSYGALVFLAVLICAWLMMLVRSRRALTAILTLLDPLRLLLLALLLVPLLLLLAPAFHLFSAAWIALFIASVAPPAALLLVRQVRERRLILAIIGVTTALAICGDLLAGAPLMKQTALGYDLPGGFRFYGLGNEFAGVLSGALLLGFYAFADYWRARQRVLLPAVMTASLAVVLLVGLPQYGANLGGMLALLLGAATACTLAFRGAARWRWLLGQSLLIAALLIALLAINIAVPVDQQSHIGRAFTAAVQRPGSLWEIAVGKWQMNWLLMRDFWWAVLPLVVIGLTGLALFRRTGLGQRALQAHPLLNAGCWGIAVAGFVGLLVNDSGIVMLATSWLYLVYAMLLMALTDLSHTLAGDDAPTSAPR